MDARATKSQTTRLRPVTASLRGRSRPRRRGILTSLGNCSLASCRTAAQLEHAKTSASSLAAQQRQQASSSLAGCGKGFNASAFRLQWAPSLPPTLSRRVGRPRQPPLVCPAVPLPSCPTHRSTPSLSRTSRPSRCRRATTGIFSGLCARPERALRAGPYSVGLAYAAHAGVTPTYHVPDLSVIGSPSGRRRNC